jgi:glycosyltransferase involved in cell wall biosynthesis
MVAAPAPVDAAGARGDGRAARRPGDPLMPRVHQVLASLGYGDAIGHEATGIQRALRAAGFESEIFTETADPRLEALTVDYRDMVDEIGADDLLIHHFSIGSRASRTAFALPCRMILVYHNITPPQYFLGEHHGLVRQCYHGRRELLAYRSRVELALGDSEFNRRELEAAGFPVTGVLPVVPDFSHLDVSPDPRVYDAFDDEATNILFVGRLIGNKRPDNLIRYAHAYRTAFNPRARLLLAGSHEHFAGYLAELHGFAARLGAQQVHILGQVTDEELTALYDVADVFLCASEHEGFCVPIVEAFYTRVPVVARASTAVPSTMDGGGLLYETTDPLEVAGLLDAVLSDEALEDRILRAQDAALSRLLARDFDRTLLSFVQQVLAGARRPPVAVDPDFWRQVRLAEELEAIREHRPSAFHALPAAPAAARLLADVGDRP